MHFENTKLAIHEISFDELAYMIYISKCICLVSRIIE